MICSLASSWHWPHMVMGGYRIKISYRNQFWSWTLCKRYIIVPLYHNQFSPKSSQNTPHSSPLETRYEVSFIRLSYNLCSISATTVTLKKSFYTGLCYNCTRLYMVKTSTSTLLLKCLCQNGKDLCPMRVFVDINYPFSCFFKLHFYHFSIFMYLSDIHLPLQTCFPYRV